MGGCVAGDDKEGAIALLVIPKLTMRPGRIVAHITIVNEFRQSLRVLPIGAVYQLGITHIGKLCTVAWTEKRVVDNHISCAPNAAVGCSPRLFHQSSALFRTGQSGRPWQIHAGYPWPRDGHSTSQRPAWP